MQFKIFSSEYSASNQLHCRVLNDKEMEVLTVKCSRIDPCGRKVVCNV